MTPQTHEDPMPLIAVCPHDNPSFKMMIDEGDFNPKIHAHFKEAPAPKAATTSTSAPPKDPPPAGTPPASTPRPRKTLAPEAPALGTLPLSTQTEDELKTLSRKALEALPEMVRIPKPAATKDALVAQILAAREAETAAKK